MNDIIRLNKKISRNKRKRYSSMKSLRSPIKGGIIFKDILPEAKDSTSAIAVDLNTYKVYFNGKDKWYSIDRFEGTVPQINNVHKIFVQRKIMFYSLFYYNDIEKIHLSEYFEKEYTDDLTIEARDGYNLYACYVEVK